MNRILGIAIVSVLLSLTCVISGCTIHLNTYFDYFSSVAIENGATIGGKLQGTFFSDKKKTILSNPYELLVWVQSSKKVIVDKIELIQIDSETVKSLDSLPQAVSTEKDKNNTVIQYFSRKGLTMEHKDMELNVKYKIDNVYYNTKIILKTNFKKFKSNRIWDIMSGV
jgi:hypothetical protein